MGAPAEILDARGSSAESVARNADDVSWEQVSGCAHTKRPTLPTNSTTPELDTFSMRAKISCCALFSAMDCWNLI